MPQRTTIKQRYEKARDAALRVQEDLDTPYRDARTPLAVMMGEEWLDDLQIMVDYLTTEGSRGK